jgi:hypothetical protein
VNAHSIPLRASRPTVRQRSVRSRSRRLSFEKAVRAAADAFFDFKYGAAQGKALWSETERVWLGCQTFLHWALWDTHIDIPWTVATADDAPEQVDELREAVRLKLIDYWAKRVASLPRKKHPGWVPLP